MTRYSRQRLRIALLVIFCLLFQQAALAAYVCPLEQTPAEASAMVGNCTEMSMQQPRDNPALCQKHCTPDTSVAADHASPAVPPLALAPLAYALVVAQPVSHVTVQADVPVAASDPPPRLRFCSLQI
jgi:hypothetical protein